VVLFKNQLTGMNTTNIMLSRVRYPVYQWCVITLLDALEDICCEQQQGVSNEN